MIKVLTDADFNTAVINADKPVLVDFFATWCGPCKMLSPTLEALSDEYDGKADFYKMDVDQNKKPIELMIQAVPTLKFYKGGEEVNEVIGLDSKENLKAKLDAIL